VAASAEEQAKKKAIYDSMSPRQQKRIDRIGYEKWDPFQEPKDPIDIRRDQTKRTTQQLVREFLQNRGHDDYSNAYGRGVLEIALGIINSDDRFIGMYEFACWYQEQLRNYTDSDS
jgi:ribosomal protein S16